MTAEHRHGLHRHGFQISIVTCRFFWCANALPVPQLRVCVAALPTLDIAEGALDKLFSIYKQLLPQMGGYLTQAGELHRGRLEMVLQQLASLELETLEQRAQVSSHVGALALPDQWCARVRSCMTQNSK